MISSHLNVLITSFKIFSTLFGVWYVCTDLVFNILPLGITIVLLFALSVYLLRIPSPDDLTIDTIIGKDPACEESNDNTSKLIKTIAHRGAGLDAPENSLIAFKMCNEKGIKFIEFDVTLTADNVAVVFHDDTLERMTDCSELVHKKTYDELKQFDIAVKHPFSERYRQTGIPTLEETVVQLLSSGQNMFIDVKDNNMKMVAVICDLYEKYPELYLRSITTSFVPNIIYFIRRRNPKIVCSLAWRPYAFTHTSYSYSTGKGPKRSDVFHKHFLYVMFDYLHESLLPMVTYYLLGISFILLHKDAICGRTVREWRDKGVRVIAWTVNHPLEKQHFARVLKVTYMTDTLTGETTTHSKSLCPDTKAFMTKQFYPGYEKLSSHLEMDIVPYGHAYHSHINGVWNFQCQHGYRECYGNRVQACALALNHDQDILMSWFNCIFSNASPVSAMRTCARSIGIDWENLEYCSDDDQGYQMLAEMGDRTHSLVPELSYVPTIIFNDVYDQDLQNAAETNFLETACNLLTEKPMACLER